MSDSLPCGCQIGGPLGFMRCPAHEPNQLRADLATAIRERDEAHSTRERLAALLDGVALALKGPPDELTMHGWHDLPALAAAERQRAERAEAQCAAMRETLIRAHGCATHDDATGTCGGCFVSEALASTDAGQALLAERDALRTALEDIGRCGIDQEFWCAIGCPADLSAYARAALERAKGEK